jgi:hypothetical protein
MSATVGGGNSCDASIASAGITGITRVTSNGRSIRKSRNTRERKSSENIIATARSMVTVMATKTARTTSYYINIKDLCSTYAPAIS